MSAEANKERKLRARSDQVHWTSFVVCLKIKDILGMREKKCLPWKKALSVYNRYFVCCLFPISLLNAAGYFLFLVCKAT